MSLNPHNWEFASSGSFNKRGFTSVYRSTNNLLPLADLTSTEWHFVADTYAGSGNWPSRVGAAVAQLSGSVSRVASSRFSNRYAIDHSAGGGFLLASGEELASNTLRTYEIVVDNYVSPNSRYLLAGGLAGGSARNIWWQRNSSTTFTSSVSDNAVGNYFDIPAVSMTNLDSKPVLITITINAATELKIYLNGTSIATDSTTAGTLLLTIGALGLGGLNDTGTFSAAFGGSVLEYARHNEVLSASVIAQRAAQFNILKGY